MKDGAYRQADPSATASASAGETFWSDYTLTLKTRKLSGAEGMVITVLNDGAGAWATWSLGGWGNQFHAVQSHYAEQDQFLGRVPGSLEIGRWYDVKIVIKGPHMDCYLDGKLIQSADVLLRRVPALFASATRDEKAGEVILKLVNPGASSSEASIRLAGVKRVRPGARAFLLTGHPEDVNSLDEPCKIATREVAAAIDSPEFEQVVPAGAMLVLRVPVE